MRELRTSRSYQLALSVAPIPFLDAGHQLVELRVTADRLEIEAVTERVDQCCCDEATHHYYVHNVLCWARILSTSVDHLALLAALLMVTTESFLVENRCSDVAPTPFLDVGHQLLELPVIAERWEIEAMIERVDECCCCDHEATRHHAVVWWARILSTFAAADGLVLASLFVASESFRVENRCSEDASCSDCHYYLQTSVDSTTEMGLCYRSSS